MRECERAADTAGSRLDRWVGVILRGGVIVSAAFVLAGAVVYLRDLPARPLPYAVFRSEPPALRSLAGIVRAAASLDGAALIQFGLLLLVATPIARVVISLVGFARENDRLYVVITLIVLVVLVVSLTGIG